MMTVLMPSSEELESIPLDSNLMAPSMYPALCTVVSHFWDGSETNPFSLPTTTAMSSKSLTQGSL